jgi:hypothetical protein
MLGWSLPSIIKAGDGRGANDRRKGSWLIGQIDPSLGQPYPSLIRSISTGLYDPSLPLLLYTINPGALS